MTADPPLRLLPFEVSVLFSEPKIPQSNSIGAPNIEELVSVLFSEPKIPQFNHSAPVASTSLAMFQCSSASRKFLNCVAGSACGAPAGVSVLFSEPKIPQCKHMQASMQASMRFSALQRAENSSIPTLAPASIHISDRDDHASSFLSLPGASP